MSINRNLAKFAPSINTSGKAAVATITVTVSGGKYYIDGTQQQTVSLSKGVTYRFDNSDSTNSGHPFVFSTQSNGGGSSFTTGITTVGTAGSTGAYVEVTLEQDAPDHLGYYCSNHSGMGGLVKTAPVGDANFASFASAFTFPTSDGSASQVLQTDGSGTISFGTPAAGYSNSDVDTHLNRSSASSSQILSWNGSDYAWVDDQSGSGGIASVAADTTPQLGGSLDVNGQAIVSASNGNIAITPNGSGKIILDGLSFPTADGSADQVLKTDGSGQLSFVAQSTGGGGGSLTATASGALADGTLVVVNADGTVSNVLFTEDASVGSEVVFDSTNAISFAAAYDANAQKVVIVYRDISNTNGEAVVGTVSGNSISFGSPVAFSNDTASACSIAYDTTNQKVLIAYRDDGDSGKGKANVGTISGTSISFGSDATFANASTDMTSVSYDANAGKFVIAFRDDGNNQYGTAIVATISGTSVSFGTEAVFNSGNAANYIAAVYDSNAQKTAIGYVDSADQYGKAVVATISGTSLSFTSEVTFENSGTSYISGAYDSVNQKVVFCYQDGSDGSKGKGVVGTISGGAITFGTPVVFNTDGIYYTSTTFDSNAQKIVVAYRDQGTGTHGRVVSGAVSGTSITFDSSTQFNSGIIGAVAVTFDSTQNRTVIAYKDNGNSNYATAIVFKPSSQSQILTSENFVGISDGAYANGATATIQTAGSTDDAQSGLTAGQSYYVQRDGTLGLSPDTIEVLAGTAVSATEILINPDTNPATFGTSQVDAHLNVSSASSGQILSWNGSDYAWTADGGGLNVVSSHSQTLSSNTTIAATDNAMSVGPITIANGVTLTISSGARYVVV